MTNHTMTNHTMTIRTMTIRTMTSRLPVPRTGQSVRRITSLSLLAVGGLHLVWATGSTFPFKTRSALNDAVVGRQVAPGPAECCAVAALLAGAAGSIAAADGGRRPWARAASAGVAVVLAIRAAFGFAGRTAVLVPGSESPRFVRLDRWVYSPICALLAAGAATAAR